MAEAVNVSGKTWRLYLNPELTNLINEPNSCNILFAAMGIPSFYKHLIQTIVGITSKTRPKVPQFFGLDLNCAIYHCVKKVQTKFPYQEDSRLKWESELVESVIDYIKQINKIVNPSQMLYIAVDGVAPMAKIKQQRMRRFKSAVLAEEEAKLRAQAKNVPYVEKPRWDTNAITPGTKFMEKLTTALKNYGKTNPKKIIVSPADEPGEGEQKIMEFLRKNKFNDAVIYGLDADLIVLSLYAFAKQGINVDLFREEVEMNGQVKSAEGVEDQEQFLYLNCEIMSQALYETYKNPEQQVQEFLIDFVALMSILGNDFVPHGMSLKIRDEGIEKLLGIYKEITVPLLKDGTYNRDALKQLFNTINEREPFWILKGIKSKLNARSFCSSRDGGDIAVAKMNDLPVKWAKELCLVETIEQDDAKPQYTLKANWQEIYDREALWGQDPEKVAKIYLEALSWTFAYYTGQQVDTHWFYPWPLPPRSETINKLLETENLSIPLTNQEPIKPLEQLAMVLPQSSFHLLPSEYANLIANHPYAWPTKWPSYSFGRRFLWECEPLIPLIKPLQMKKWIETLYD